MLCALGSRLPEYRVKASNNEPDSSNLLYNQEHARRYGFCGGVVPPVCVYAYISRSVVEFFGAEWLHRGSADVCFVHPVYDGEEIRVSGYVSNIGRDGAVSAWCKAANGQGIDCGVAAVTLRPESTAARPPSAQDYPPGTGKLHRAISLATLKPGAPLVPLTAEFTRATNWEYCQKGLKDHHPLYARYLHPGWLASQANRLLTANFELAAWIHVSSSLQKYHSQCEECTVETRGRVLDFYEQQGNHFVVLDVGLFSGGRCLETMLQTVIFRIAPAAA